MNKSIFLFFTALLFTSCQSGGRFIHFDQGCSDGSDHYEAQVFIANDSCHYFKKLLREYKKTDFMKNRTETLTLVSSALVINKEYYNEVQNLLKKYTQPDPKECAINYEVYNSRKKSLHKGYISAHDYTNFTNEIQKLNSKYTINKENNTRIEWYFSLVESGMKPRHTN